MICNFIKKECLINTRLRNGNEDNPGNHVSLLMSVKRRPEKSTIGNSNFESIANSDIVLVVFEEK